MGDRDFGELSLKDIVTSLRDWKGGIDGWPEAWQRKGLGEHWQWQEVWRNWKRLLSLLPHTTRLSHKNVFSSFS